MKVILLDDQGNQLYNPYIIRIQGWTEEQYYRESPRDRKCEFVRGELIMSAAMSMDHGDIVMFLGYLLKGFCDAKGLGKVFPGVTIRLRAEVNREPDIYFIQKEKVPKSSEIPLKVIPPFIIEVSHTTRSIDLGEKAEDYQMAFVQEYWVVDMDEEEVVVHLLEDGQYKREKRREGRLESQVVKGFYIDVNWLWERPMPSAFDCLKGILGM